MPLAVQTMQADCDLLDRVNDRSCRIRGWQKIVHIRNERGPEFVISAGMIEVRVQGHASAAQWFRWSFDTA